MKSNSSFVREAKFATGNHLKETLKVLVKKCIAATYWMAICNTILWYPYTNSYSTIISSVYATRFKLQAD